MLTIAQLTVIISSFCGFKLNVVNVEYKEACMEHMVNCTIVEDGRTSKALVDKCVKKWKGL